MVNYISCLRQRLLWYPGVAKFGIALEWGSRGPEFESRHSDQSMIIRTLSSKRGTGSDLSFQLKQEQTTLPEIQDYEMYAAISTKIIGQRPCRFSG